jgi:hypothetical protein
LTADPASTSGFEIVFKTGTPAGPVIYVNSQGGALQYVKVAFVYSVMDTKFKPDQTANPLYPAVYQRMPVTPFTSTLSYSSSYIFTKVASFNTAVPIAQGDTTKTSGATITYNQHYMRLPDARYAIYGLTGFSFPQNKNSLCSSTIWVNTTLNNINTYTISTPNSNPSNFWFSADIFSANVFTLCTPSDGVSPFSFLTNIGKKSFFTVPTQSIQQYIQEWPIDTITTASITTTNTDAPNAPGGTVTATAWPGSDFAGVSYDNVPDPSAANTHIYAASQAVFLQYYGANNGNNDTILFRAELPYTGLTVGAPIKIEFGFFDGPWPIGKTAVATPDRIGMIDDASYNIQLSVNGFIVYQTVFKPKVGTATASTDKIYFDATLTQPFTRVSQIFKGMNINSATANVVITISYARSKDQDQNLFTYVVLSQYLQAYDPNTGCCVSSCPANTGLDTTISPPTCVYCDSRAGLWYNPNNGTCTCLPGFYLDSTKTFQCYACSALYCSVCNPSNPAQCTTCATGALLSNTFNCTCSSGYFVNGTTCQ